MSDGVAIGEVVVTTETIEHDIKKNRAPLRPRFKGAQAHVAEFRRVASKANSFQVEGQQKKYRHDFLKAQPIGHQILISRTVTGRAIMAYETLLLQTKLYLPPSVPPQTSFPSLPD